MSVISKGAGGPLYIMAALTTLSFIVEVTTAPYTIVIHLNICCQLALTNPYHSIWRIMRYILARISYASIGIVATYPPKRKEI